MFNEITLINRSGSQAPLIEAALPLSGSAVSASNTFYFKTCLRQIVIVDGEGAAKLIGIGLGEHDQIYRGTEAYRFILQVVCGLHSPLIGETEVSGQFKLAVAAYQIPATPWGQQLKRFFQNLFEDAKRVRQLHLVDLGSQSYGSVLRRELKSQQSVRRIHILGAGHLVQEILPWIAKDGTEVHVYARDVEKARGSLGERNGVEIHSLSEVDQSAHVDPAKSIGENDAIVVAAPVTAAWVSAWISRNQSEETDAQPRLVADLRADSAEDRIELQDRVLDLSQVFAQISSTQTHLEAKKAAALLAIDAAVHARSCHVEYRPFGWEDVCA